MKIIKISTSEEYIKFFNLFNKLFKEFFLDIKSFNELFYSNFNIQETNCYMAIDNNEPIGIISGSINKLKKDIYVHFIGVVPNYRRSGIGSALLNKFVLEDYSTYFSGCPNGYLVPGLDTEIYKGAKPFFDKNRFDQVDIAISMQRRLDLFNKAEYYDFEAGKSYSIVTFNDYYFPSVMELLEDSEHVEWQDVFNKAYLSHSRRNLGCLAICDNKVIGFAGFGVIGNDISRFGPIYVSKDYRKRKIGLNLTVSVLEEQKKLGCKKSYFLWGENNSVAVKMYMKLGFEPFSNMSILKLSNK